MYTHSHCPVLSQQPALERCHGVVNPRLSCWRTGQWHKDRALAANLAISEKGRKEERYLLARFWRQRLYLCECVRTVSPAKVFLLSLSLVLAGQPCYAHTTGQFKTLTLRAAQNKFLMSLNVDECLGGSPCESNWPVPVLFRFAVFSFLLIGMPGTLIPFSLSFICGARLMPIKERE